MNPQARALDAMTAPLLATKLHIPATRPETVARPRLIQRLNAGLYRRLTLVSAPAGFGKTTLLSQWLERRNGAAAWLSLDEGDNDPARFLGYLVAALQTVNAGIGVGVQAALLSPQPPPLTSLLAALINEIAAAPEADAPLVLVLDDYHLVQDRQVHDAVAFLLERLPPPPAGAHLIIASRTDPPLPLSRLRIRHQLTELRAADLRFTTDEAAAFLNQTMGLALSPQDVAALETRTEGWIAGLQVAALSMQGRQDTAGFIRAFTGGHRYVLDYLVEEVLQRQPAEVQTFLLQTAILDRLAAPLCNALTFRDDGQTTLEALERANLFIVPLDDERRWYRYHRLFADLLRAQLGRDAALPLHHRAADWYERHGYTAEAIGHALAAQDTGRAAELVAAHGRQMLVRGELTTLLRWLAALPETAIRARPMLAVYDAWALTLTGQGEKAEGWLESALAAAGDSPALSEVQGHAAAIRAYIAAQRGDTAQTTEQANRALALLPQDELTVRSVVAFTLGATCVMSNDLAGAARAFAEAGRLGQQGGNLHAAVSAVCHLADLQVRQGRLRQAAETYRRALALATGPQGRLLPVAASAHSGLGELLHEWNDLEAAARHLAKGIELGAQWGNVDALCGDHVALARVRLAQRDLAGALASLEEAERLVREQTVHPLAAAQVGAFRAHLWLVEGNLAAAGRWVQDRGLTVESDPATMHGGEALVLARLLMARGKAAAAARWLARLLAWADGSGRLGDTAQVLAMLALADSAQSLAHLERALSLAEAEGYVRLFVDEGPPMAALLRRAAWQGIAADYAGRLLAVFEAGAASPPPSGALPEPLSERELEVLRLVAAGLSNREIAGRLVIAVSTVKSHTNSLYGKLNVKNRTQAVARARALGLL